MQHGYRSCFQKNLEYLVRIVTTIIFPLPQIVKLILFMDISVATLGSVPPISPWSVI